MQNGDLDPGYDIGPGNNQLPIFNSEPMHQSGANGMVPIDVISGFREDENGHMEVEYERAFVQRPPEGIFHEPLDHGSGPTRRLPNRHYYDEKERLASYYGRWSTDYYVRPRDLARDGLYYIGPGDRVKCAFCQEVLRGWEPGDDVEREHRRLYPNCPFVLGRCNHMNVLLNSPETMQYSYGVKVRQEEGSSQRSFADKMQVVNNRLKTFDHYWPANVPVDPKLLAEAGLYYIGDKDKTKCFKCLKIIKNWEKGDDPWREHARLYPNCPYVLEQKGVDFVQAASLPVARASSGTGAAPQQVTSGTSQPQQQHHSQVAEASGIVNQMSRLQIDEDMNSPVVKVFREYFEEVPVERIRHLLEQIRLERGPEYKFKQQDLEPLTRN